MVKLSDVKIIAKNFNLSMQSALSCILKASPCVKCHKQGILEYFDSQGSSIHCLFCDYTIE